ncbi:MAG: O-methyltransferase [Sphingomonadales bacterium]
MHSLLITCIDYLKFYYRSNSSLGHGIHSPFAYRFAREVVNEKADYVDYKTAKNWRKELLNDNTLLPIIELGAGSATAPGLPARRVADLALRVAKSTRTGRLLYRIARYYQPEYMVELGTSLGLSAAWFSLARPTATIHTIEGNEAVAKKAQSHFDRWSLSNISLTTGSFASALPIVLDRMPRVDLAFLDGHHEQQPTLHYFEQLLAKKHPDSVFIVDDIYWSRGMKAAWQTIKQHPEVRCTIDLFQFGLVFFKEEFKEVRHFSIRF